MIPPVIADAGTPLLWGGIIHLTIGNLFIGILEALVIRWGFKVKGAALFAWIIFGNYVSSIAGVVFVANCADGVIRALGGPLPIYKINQIFAVLAGITFLITILFEWPFYWLGMRSERTRVGKAFWTNLIGNAASYWLLVVWYLGYVNGPGRWGMQLCEANEIQADPGVRIQYLSPGGRELLQLRLGESAPTRVAVLAEPSPDGELGVVPGDRPGQWRVTVKNDPWSNGPVRDVAVVVSPSAMTNPSVNTQPGPEMMSDGGSVTDLQADATHPWTGYSFWGMFSEIDISNETTHQRYNICNVEIPGQEWAPNYPTLLPNDRLVFSFGEQIMVADLHRGVVAAVEPGSSPVVILDESAPAAQKSSR